MKARTTQKSAPKTGAKAKAKSAPKMEDAKIPKGGKKNPAKDEAKQILIKNIISLATVANDSANATQRELLGQLSVSVTTNNNGRLLTSKEIAKKAKELYKELFGEEYKEVTPFDFKGLEKFVELM